MTRIMRCTGILLACTAVAQISMPLVGYFRDRAGSLRPVHGVAGAFVPGDVIEQNVLAAAWSGSAGFAKTETELLLLNRVGIHQRMEAPAGPASFGFGNDGAPAWVRFADGSCREFATACPSEPSHTPMPRVRLPEEIDSWETLGDGWILARGKNALYAVRTERDTDRVYELPEQQQ